jgi:hypothetical protein
MSALDGVWDAFVDVLPGSSVLRTVEAAAHLGDSRLVAPCEELRVRWSLLLAHTGTDEAKLKALGVGPALAHWREVLAAHPTCEGLDWAEVQALAAELATAEGNAHARGYALPAGTHVSPAGTVRPSPTPSLEEANPVTTSVDRARRDAEKADPYLGLKLAAVAGLGVGTIAATVSARGDGARAGIAVGGSLLTFGALWGLLAPASKRP